MKKETQFRHKKLVYKIRGNGSPVMLIHGFGVDASIWDPLLERLEEHFKFIIPDLPGIGDSERLEDGSMELYAEAIKATLIAAGEEKAVIIGHSMGGYIALALAQNSPEIFSGLGLFHSSAVEDDEEKRSGRTKTAEFINEHGSAAYMRTAVDNYVSDEEKHANLLKDLLEKAAKFDAETMTQQVLAMRERPDRTNILKEFKKPVLFVIGSDDKLMPAESLLEQVSLAEKVQVSVLKESGHLGMLEEPDNAAAAVREFIDFCNVSLN